MTKNLEHFLDNPSAAPRPSLARGFLLRFGFAYWVLFCIPVVTTQLGGLDWLGKPITPFWDAIVTWVGNHLLAIPGALGTGDNGSGDRTGNWVFLFVILWLALIAAGLWSALDRGRAHDARLRAVLRVLIRYNLAFVILTYGVIKLFVGQFPLPSAGRLVQRYGDSSPMGLLWTFMGASPAYVFFSGAAETLGAVLLLFRRTTTLGALVLAAVLTNVVMLNFCYDVPVKINSAHYLAMCLALLVPDLGRIANVIVFNRATQPVSRDLVLPKPWMRVARRVVKYGAIAIVMYAVVARCFEQRPSGSGSAWYDGTWNVTAFVRNGADVPAIVTDATRWQRIRFQAASDKVYARWRFMNEVAGGLCTVQIDEQRQMMVITPVEPEAKQPAGPVTLSYTRVDDQHFKLEGKVGADTLAMQLELLDASSMLLLKRGFHWVNEAPFSR